MTDAENFSLSHRLQTEFEAHLASYQTGTMVKEYVELYAFMTWCLVKQRDNFTFNLPLH